MSWRNRLLAAAGTGLMMLGLAGCGFHPLYAAHDRNGLDPALASVQVDQIHDRLGQVLTNQLRDGFNPTSTGVPARYRLEVALTKQEYDSALRSDGTASHTTVRISASYVLRGLADGKPAVTGTVRSDNGLDVLDNQYANTIGEQTEELRAVRDVGDQIHERVALYLRQVASKP
ncbi:MAG TPA: LPS assembly lipoprotein LptE [Aliidongia sp.]|uniref:LPS assembly lipoprotein LptE n=1 Tax=Aliidongia sp. TaxID=1914230 RepID=UPI002DDCE759|nr:LPS assembly lipoprotein LptE [Aliidongia sp.]HEV2676879.1 LPS assembly lipoprotein LptE [Aliidongia sp.]